MNPGEAGYKMVVVLVAVALALLMDSMDRKG